ncbi:MAG: hypothetical protein CK427_06185 [Leptospira sp.]|nr:MAG: hypothetical protein CK427_06185 [Leptospira sp.]
MGDLDKDKWYKWETVKNLILGKYSFGQFYQENLKTSYGYLGDCNSYFFKKSKNDNKALCYFNVYIDNGIEYITLYNLKRQIYYLDMSLEEFEN